MDIKAWARKLPILARYGTKVDTLKERNRKLHEQNRALRADRKRLADSGRHPRDVWVPPTRDRRIELVHSSGLFDPAWYLAQLTPAERDLARAAPVVHFVDHGETAGHSPHPGFVPDHYAPRRAQVPRARRAVVNHPFTHYLDLGGAQGSAPHPLFNATAYLAAHPDSSTAPGGPLGAFLSHSEPLLPTEGGTGQPWDDPIEFLAVARAAGEAIHDTRGYQHIPRDRDTFDSEREDRTKAELRAHPLPADPPLVTVILTGHDPTAALDSALAQSYPHCQVIVVGDDGTGAQGRLPAPARDPRIDLLRSEDGQSRSAARNAALQRATGRYVAYLDDDCTWSPDFLEMMVQHLLQSGDGAAYAITELTAGEQRLFRGLPFDKDHLAECNISGDSTLVHEHALLDQTGGYADDLAGAADWDLLLRLADQTRVGFVPILAAQRELGWSLAPSPDENLLRNRVLVDLSSVINRDPDPSLVSIVMTLDAEDHAATVVSSVQRALQTAGGPVEVVVVDAKCRPGVFTAVHAHLSTADGVTLHRVSQTLPMEVARNLGLSLTTGRTVVFMPSAMWTESEWDLPLREALNAHRVVQPLVLAPSGQVWSAGIEYLSNGHRYLPWAGFGADAPEVRAERTVAAVSAAVLAARASDVANAGGFDPLAHDDLHGGELSLRLQGDRGTAACAPASVVTWRHVVSDVDTDAEHRRVADNRRRERDLAHRHGAPARDLATTLPGYQLVGFDRPSRVRIVPRPLLVHDRPNRPLRWAIKMGPPNVEQRTSWGDWHFAQSLRDSLERLGHEVTIDARAAWYRPTSHLDDVVLQLRGARSYEVNPGHINVSWVISHPDRVDAAELSDYDLTFGASSRWCAVMTRELGRPVQYLPQCTDHRRFRPVEAGNARTHEVLVVANARGLRPAVAAALDEGVIPAVYGLNWDGLLPDGAWQADHVPNADLPALYAAAGVVLNDHWEDMREKGMISNRLFDAVACEARVVSDHLPEIVDLFGDVVVTYGDGQGIATAITRQLADTPERAQARRELGGYVREHHTFDARARRITQAVTELRGWRHVTAT